MQESVVAVAVIVQVTALPDAGVAVKVTVAPITNELAVKVGVLSLVFLSVLEEPVSDAASSVTEVGIATVIPVVVMVRLAKVAASFPNSSWTLKTSSLLLGSE